MFYKNKAKILFFSLILLLLGVSFFVFQNYNNVQAAKYIDPDHGDKLAGFAWSSNFGWISFNSADCDVDGDGNYEGNAETPPAPSGCPSNGVVKDYGVDVDKSNGDMSGYAWSENIGWICFGASCSGVDPDMHNPAQAKYNKSTKIFSGWAKAVVLNDDGWIRLNNLSWDSASKEINGYAWNGNGTNGLGIGWISFNCKQGNTSGGNTCSLGHDYRVIGNLNVAPTVSGGTLYNTTLSQSVLPPGSSFVNPGNTAEFRITDWEDKDFGDHVYAIFCKNNTGLNLPDINNPTTWDCVGGATWCKSEPNFETSQNPSSNNNSIKCSKIFSSADAGASKSVYAYACDEWGNCSGAYHYPNTFIANDQPKINGHSTSPTAPFTQPTEGPEVTIHDNEVNFSVDWEDHYSNNKIAMHVCRGSDTFSITADSCIDGSSNSVSSYCDKIDTSSSANNNTGTVSCVYDLSPGEVGTRNYQVYICDGYDSCSNATTDHFVVNNRPVVGVMSAPNFGPTEACANPVIDKDLEASIKWSFSDNDNNLLNNYRITLFNNTDGNSVYTDKDKSYLGNAGANCINHPPLNSECKLTLYSSSGTNNEDVLQWNKSYSFSIQVYDGIAWSQKRTFDHSSADVLTSDSNVNTTINSINPEKTFSTYVHNFPVVNIDNVTFLPDPPSAGEEVRLTPDAKYYTSAMIQANCDTTHCSYSWNLNLPPDYGDFKSTSNDTSSHEEPIAIFSDDGIGGFELEITDNENYTCSAIKSNLDVNKRLPTWTETY